MNTETASAEASGKTRRHASGAAAPTTRSTQQPNGTRAGIRRDHLCRGEARENGRQQCVACGRSK